MSGGECLGTRSAGSGLLDAEALVDRWIAGKSSCPVSRPSSGWSLSDSSLSIAVGEDAAPRVVRWRGIVDHLGIELRGVEAFPGLIHERVARPSYRSVRGSPNWGKTRLSANQVIADIRSPSSVRTNSPRGRAMSVLGMGR
jgi:hypothetical protein